MAAPTVATLVTSDAGTADATSEERHGRRRRRRRGRGGRNGEGEAAVGVEATGDEIEEVAKDTTEVPPTVDLRVPASAETSSGNGSATAAHEVAVVAPQMIVVPPTFSPPAVQPAPMPVQQLESVLEVAGLTLVQTAPAKLEEAHTRMASELRPARVPRERAILPPLDTGPLQQVETRGNTQQSAS
jgi:ribonuclease E